MKDKDLIYIGIIAYLGYLLLNKNKNNEVKIDKTKSSPVGNASNGGLNLTPNMDLPNLTATPDDGLPTETALNESNISPLIKDDEPTQIYGSYNLPLPYYNSPVVTTTPQSQVIVSNENLPTIATEIIGTPLSTGSSLIQEPVLPIKDIKGEISTTLPIMAEPITNDEVNSIISKCGNSFSLPNNDKEGSYTNYWIYGKDFYTQTTSPLIKTIPVKISNEAFIEGCKKYQMFQFEYSKKFN
jgi:hypothetical protein